MAMIARREDFAIIKQMEVREMLVEYERRFGEGFVTFNYADFKDKDGKLAAEIYTETLAQALKDNKPYHIVSHQYDVLDH